MEDKIFFMSIKIAFLFIKFYICSEIFLDQFYDEICQSELDKLEDTTKNQQNTTFPNEMQYLYKILKPKEFLKINEYFSEMKIADLMLKTGIQKIFNKNIISNLDKVANSFAELDNLFSTDLKLLKYLKMDFCEDMFPFLYKIFKNHKIIYKEVKFLWQLYQKLEIYREIYIKGIFNFYDKIEEIFVICAKIDYCKSFEIDGTIKIFDTIKFKLHFDELNSFMPFFEKNYNHDYNVGISYLKYLHWVNKKKIKLYNEPDFSKHYYLVLLFKRVELFIHELSLIIYDNDKRQIQCRRFEQDFFQKTHPYFFETLNDSKINKISCLLLLDLLGIKRCRNLKIKIKKLNEQNAILQDKISNPTHFSTNLFLNEKTDGLICYLEQIIKLYKQLYSEYEAYAKKNEKIKF